MSNTLPMKYHFSAVTAINWTLDEHDLQQFGDDIEQIINSWLGNHTNVDAGSDIPVSTRQEMLRVITNFMCSDKFEWSESND